jgi:hypothetical protein
LVTKYYFSTEKKARQIAPLRSGPPLGAQLLLLSAKLGDPYGVEG